MHARKNVTRTLRGTFFLFLLPDPCLFYLYNTLNFFDYPSDSLPADNSIAFINQPIK